MQAAILYTVMTLPLWPVSDHASAVVVSGDRLTDLEARVQALKQQTSAVVVSGDRLTDLETRVQALKQQTSAVEDSNAELRQEVRELKRKIPELQGKHRPVVFTAQFSHASIVNISERDTLRFDNVLINLGGGYNPGTGVFRAPLAGVYQFLLQTVSKPRQFLALEVLKQGVVVSEAFTYQGVDSDWGDIGFCAVLLRLEIGDDVHVRNRLHDGALYGLHWTQFSGVLLAS